MCEKSPTSNQQASFAQCKAISYDDGIFNVAVRKAPPFVYEKTNRVTGETVLSGIAVDFWEAIAGRLGVEYQYVCLGLSDTLSYLEKGEIDIAISPLTITKKREQAFDFSHQYFNSGLVFASSPAESHFDFDKAFKTMSSAFKSSNLLYLVATFAVLLLAMILLALKNLRDYQAMPVMKDKPKPAVVMHVVLYSLLNISGIRKDVFGFSCVHMQLFSVLILICGITVSASLFSMVTASLTQSVTPKKDFSFENIDQYEVATLQGSTAQRFLCESQKQPSSIKLTTTWKEAMLQVADSKTQLVLGDWVQLVYLSQEPELRDRVTVHNHSLRFEPYGWGLKTNHPLKDKINQELIGLLRDPLGADIVSRYIGNERLGLR